MEIVRNGMTMVPEGRRVFPRTSVMDNLLLGAYSRKDKENVKGDLNKIFEMFPRLLERKNQLAGTLIRRRTADAGYGARTDVKTKTSAP